VRSDPDRARPRVRDRIPGAAWDARRRRGRRGARMTRERAVISRSRLATAPASRWQPPDGPGCSSPCSRRTLLEMRLDFLFGGGVGPASATAGSTTRRREVDRGLRPQIHRGLVDGAHHVRTDGLRDRLHVGLNPACDSRKAGALNPFSHQTGGKVARRLCFYLNRKKEKKKGAGTVSETVSVSRVRVRVCVCVRADVRACIRASLSTSAC
jgi:hypothetical protein